MVTKHPEFSAWDEIITVHQLLFLQELTFQRHCDSFWQKASSFTSTWFLRTRRETDNREWWKDSEVDSWSLSKGRPSAPAVYITDGKHQGWLEHNSPLPNLIRAHGLTWALETAPYSMDINIGSVMYIYVSVYALRMYCWSIQIICKYTHSYLFAHPFANLSTESGVTRAQALTLPLTNSQLDSWLQGQELCPPSSEFCPLPLVEFPSNCSINLSWMN